MTLFVPRGLPADYTVFLVLLAVRPSLTRRDYQDYVHVSEHTAKRHLVAMAAAELVIASGATRARRYQLGPAARIVDGQAMKMAPINAEPGPDADRKAAEQGPNQVRKSSQPMFRIDLDHMSFRRSKAATAQDLADLKLLLQEAAASTQGFLAPFRSAHDTPAAR